MSIIGKRPSGDSAPRRPDKSCRRRVATVAWLMLWLDPAWDPIGKDPRFQALFKKYADQAPANLPAATGSAP